MKFINYYKRAEEFFIAMKDEIEFERYNASALLGIHASIALTDALSVYENGIRAADEQHIDTIRILRSICNKKGISEDGSKRLGKVLSKKNSVAYGEKIIDINELKNISLIVERFFSWAYKNFEYLNKEFQ